MIPEFKKYLDLLYLNISGLWTLSLRDVREKLLKELKPSTLETSIISKNNININIYKLAHKLPEAPFANNEEINKFIRWQAQLMITSSYEWFKESDYWKGENLKNQPDIIKLFKYIRDASVHNNVFEFKDKRFLPLHWRSKTLDKTWEGKSLFSDWMSLGDIEYLFEDISKKIIKK